MPAPVAGVRTEPMTGAHAAAAVLEIYQAGIEEGNATFETCAPDWAVFTAARLPAHRYVAVTEGQVAGWVAASAVSGRCVYAGVVEHSARDQAGSAHRASTRPFRSSASISSNATLTLPSRQYTRYPYLYK
jgi:L-amino acid N-acyltransferase YncA